MAEVLERRLTDATSKAEAKKTLEEMFIAERSSFQTAKEDEIEAFKSEEYSIFTKKALQ